MLIPHPTTNHQPPSAPHQVLKPAFRRWHKFERVRLEAAGGKYFEALGVRHYWDLAAAGTAVDDSVLL